MKEGGFHPPASLVSDVGARHTSQLLVGVSVDTHRVLQGVSGAFGSSTAQFTAGILFVGIPSGANSTITWSQETPQGERTLFTQQAALRPRGMLYVSARGSVRVTQGLYRVHASIAGDEHDAVFVVGATGTPPDPVTGGFGKSRRFQADTQALASADPAPGTTSVTSTPDACAGYSDSQLVQDCADWWGENSPKSNGPTTTYACPSSVKPAVFVEQQLSEFGGNVAISANASLPGCPDVDLTLAGGVRAAAPATIAHGGGNLRWIGSTCNLAGASDTFGDVVEARATEPGTPPVTNYTPMREFGPIPGVLNPSAPVGSIVRPGTKISLTVVAVVLAATHGIKSLVVRAPDGTDLGHAGLAQPAAPCDLSWPRFRQWVTVSYKVPNNPPPVIELNVSAETFDGSRAAFPVRYATKPTWSGTLNLTVDQTVPSNGGQQHEEYKADVVVTEAGVNKLDGHLRGEWTQTLMLPHCPSGTVTPGSVEAPLTGTFDSTGMHLTAGAATSTPPVQTPCLGQQPGLMGNPLLFPELAQLLGDLEPKGNGHFAGSLQRTDPGGGYPYTVRADLQLHPGADVSPDSPAVSIDLATPPTH